MWSALPPHPCPLRRGEGETLSRFWGIQCGWAQSSVGQVREGETCVLFDCDCGGGDFFGDGAGRFVEALVSAAGGGGLGCGVAGGEWAVGGDGFWRRGARAIAVE